LRQLFVQDLGHEEPTILLTNQRHTPVKALLTRYAQRMLIENALSDAVRFFHIDALSSAVGLKVDFDMAMLVLASGLYRLIARARFSATSSICLQMLPLAKRKLRSAFTAAHTCRSFWHPI
jgi:hypothetical protein